ncbi:hypothetical protein MAUB1S_08161 [Mycolicibacterium aubagnense]
MTDGLPCRASSAWLRSGKRQTLQRSQFENNCGTFIPPVGRLVKSSTRRYLANWLVQPAARAFGSGECTLSMDRLTLVDEPVSNASTGPEFVPDRGSDMRTFRDAKAMAKTLRQGLRERKLDLSHSDCLELVAHQFGLADWNTLSAKIEPQPDKSVLPLPEGWIVSGSRSGDYQMGVDEGVGAALIRSRHGPDHDADTWNGFGTLMQTFLASGYLGKRIMLTASLRTEAVEGAATLWLRVDGAQGKVLNFDNMEARPAEGVLRGANGWTMRRIVLDVEEGAEIINFGFYLRGTGSVWAREFDLTEVGSDVAPTVGSRPERSRPINLDFSRRSQSAQGGS